MAADANSHMAYTSFPNPAAQSNGSGVAEPVARGDVWNDVESPSPRSHEFLLQAAAVGNVPDPCWRTDGEFPSRFLSSATDHPRGGDPCLSADERDVCVWGNWGANSERLESCTGQLDESDPALNDIEALSHGSSAIISKHASDSSPTGSGGRLLAAHVGQMEVPKKKRKCIIVWRVNCGGSGVGV